MIETYELWLIGAIKVETGGAR